LPDGNLADYVINHKDAIPGNDTVSNLEWCTQQENVIHGQKYGNKKVSIALQVMDVKTGVVEDFSSVGSCSKSIGLERYSIRLRLEKGPEFVWPEGKRYRKYAGQEEWPVVSKLDFGRSREVLVRSLRDRSVTYFEKLSDVLHLIGYKLPAVWKWTNDKRQIVVPGLYQIQFANNAEPWREVEDVFEELQDGMRCKIVLEFDEDWGNAVWYESARACGSLNGLKATTMNYRLKSMGQKVFSDGKRYCYYDDLTEDQKKIIRYEIPPEGRVQRPSKATAHCA